MELFGQGSLFALLVAVVHTLAATAVSIHVLLSHREVRSSIGWIGLAWLSPVIGSGIYLVFGINRISRRAAQIGLIVPGGKRGEMRGAREVLAKKLASGDILQSTGIISIAEAGDAITGLPLTGGNDLAFYCNGDQAYPEMLKAIAQAKYSVALACYIFAADKAGQQFIAALIGAHRRGVAVRVLVDGIGSGYFRSPVVEALREGGVPVEQFLHNWLPWMMTFINLRNHKKLLIVDGKTAFTGGMNIADNNIGGAGAPKVQDVQARLKGPVVRQLMLNFAWDWDFTAKEELQGNIWWPELKWAGRTAMRGIASGPDDNMGHIEAVIATAIEQAIERIRIVTPYFLPEDPLFKVLQRAALRGVKVDLVLPQKTNHFYFNWAIAAHLATFPLDGIDCYLSAEPFDHSKLMSVDGHWSMLGSANWDARSMRLNFEYQVECYGRQATGMVDDLIEGKISAAKKLTAKTLACRSILVKLRDASARLFLPYM